LCLITPNLKGPKSVLYHPWEYSVTKHEATIVRPDGCRDIILAAGEETAPAIWITELDNQPRSVALSAGASLTGFRLSPGISIDPQLLAASEATKPAELCALIQSETDKNPEVRELITALTTPNATVADIARRAGTTPRTLQRHFRNMELPTPDFWRLLGRARRAIHALPRPIPLSEIAYAFGYSDQAHMTREFVRWFGSSPAELRKSPATIDEICQPGLGNWLDDAQSELGDLL
jgi:AraC-like DNA-binding protein